MDNDLSSLAKNLADSVSGKGKKLSLESVAKLLGSENGKKVISAILSDGGERVRRAAEAAKAGNTEGIREIISSISETAEGASLLRELGGELER